MRCIETASDFYNYTPKTLCEILTVVGAMPLFITGTRVDCNLPRRGSVRSSFQREAASGADCHGVIAIPYLYEIPSISCDWHHMFGVQHQAVPTASRLCRQACSAGDTGRAAPFPEPIF